MGERDDGGPAFPHQPPLIRPLPDGNIELVELSGMSLRDWFAGQALAGMADRQDARYPSGITEAAYTFADAMLLARKEKQS